MERHAPPPGLGAAVNPVSGAGPPALTDAVEILARAAADEAETDRARTRYLAQPMPALEPDAQIAPLLGPGETVLAIRRVALVDRRQPVRGSADPSGLAGDLYLTSRRLVHVGRQTLSFDLDDIDEVLQAGERLLMAMRDGQGVALGVAQPRLLRVEIAAARVSARR